MERAHRLRPGEGLDLAKLADRIDADLWLIWSSPADPTRTCNSIESLGSPAHRCLYAVMVKNLRP